MPPSCDARLDATIASVIYRFGRACARLRRPIAGIPFVEVPVLRVATLLLTSALAAAAAAQTADAPWPTKPVRFIVPFPAGGSTDTVARIVGQMLSVRLGQQFVVENRTGASGNLGAEAVARAAPDG